MTHEKIFTLNADRIVKLIIKTGRQVPASAMKVKLNVLIQAANEQQFRVPISTTHPEF